MARVLAYTRPPRRNRLAVAATSALFLSSESAAFSSSRTTSFIAQRVDNHHHTSNTIFGSNSDWRSQSVIIGVSDGASSHQCCYWRSSSVLVSFISTGSLQYEVLTTNESATKNKQQWNSLCNDQIQSLLVCGDGDLSYSASIAPALAELGIALTATVLEDQDTHLATYRQSEKHTETILSHDMHTVKFGINATDLITHFPPSADHDDKPTKFDRIQFNFPHWRGKANNRYNRQLLDHFLRSASDFISEDVGEIHVALCEGQGGGTAKTKKEWRESWKAAEYASRNGLLLRNVLSPYKPVYDLSSHRGMDRAFRLGKEPKLYIFNKPDKEAAVKTEESLQLCCRHELHVNLPPEGQDMRSDSIYSLDDIVNGSAIQRIVDEVVDKGVRVEVPMRRVLTPEEAKSDVAVAVFLIVYCGEGTMITRDQADGYRAALEETIQNYLPLRSNRAGRLVSRPFPYPLLSNLIYHYLQPRE